MKLEMQSLASQIKKMAKAVFVGLVKVMWYLLLLPLELAVKVVEHYTKLNKPIKAWLGFVLTFSMTTFGLVISVLGFAGELIGISFIMIILASLMVTSAMLALIIIVDLIIAGH